MNHSVVICNDENLSAQELLEKSLEKTLFWKQIEERRLKKKIGKAKFSILIKPDLDMCDTNSSTGTDSLLVEHLISLLGEKGYRNIIVADSDGETGCFLENREACILADLLGYRYITDNKTPYQVVNLSEALRDAKFEKSSVLAGEKLSAHWLDADFRIIFCKNKTDEEFYYSLCLKSLIDILPEKAKGYHYYFRRDPSDVALTMFNRNEVDFCLIDAFTSNHGMQGNRHNNPLLTKTMIAGNNILISDFAGALKMGLDPYDSLLNGSVLRKKGLPLKYSIDGNLHVYPGWKNVPRVLSESIRARNKNPLFRQLSNPWLRSINTSLFPFKHVADDQANKFLEPILKNIDEHPLAYNALIVLNLMLSGYNNFVNAYQTVYNKERIFRNHSGLGFDIKKFSEKDFEEIEDYITPLAQIISHTEPDKNGLKWRYMDQSVVFEFTRTLPYDYSQFCKKVDISNSVQNMYDNIGGTVLPVKIDNNKKIIYQAERDIYLPQPNWMAWFGGEPIDACKIELIRYKPKSQSIYWRTVDSVNGSAEYDDGMVEFSHFSKGVTKISIMARQKFKLPLFWNIFNIDYLPRVKDVLVSDSYMRFFSRTIANYEAVYEGRNAQTGRTADYSWSEHNSYDHPLLSDQLKNIFGVFTSIIEKIKPEKNNGIGFDEDGYRHFNNIENPKKDSFHFVGELLSDLAKTVQKDMHYITQP